MKKISLLYLILIAIPACTAADHNYLAANQEENEEDSDLQPLTPNGITLLAPIFNSFSSIDQNKSTPELLQSELLLNQETDLQEQPFSINLTTFSDEEVLTLLQEPISYSDDQPKPPTTYRFAKKEPKRIHKSQPTYSKKSSKKAQSTDPASLNSDCCESQPAQKPKIHPFLEESEVWKLDETYYYRCYCDSTYIMDNTHHWSHIHNVHREDFDKIKAEKEKPRKCEKCPKIMNFKGFGNHRSVHKKTTSS